MILLRAFKIFLLLSGSYILFSCQQQDNDTEYDTTREKQLSSGKVEIRATDLLVQYRVPPYNFSVAIATKYFRRDITDPDSLLIVSSLLAHMNEEIMNVRQEYIAGLIISYGDKQDSIGFGYRGIYHKGKLYKYTANEEIVRFTASLVPEINKYTLLLALNPDDIRNQERLQEAIDKAMKSGGEK